MRTEHLLLAALALLLLTAACSGDDDEASTTSGLAVTTASSTTPSITGPTTTDTVLSTSTTIVFGGIPSYTIERREPGQGGDTVVVLVKPGSYTDLDLENVVADARERFAPIATLHLVDDLAAVPLVLAEEAALDDDQLDFLAEHYFVRLEEGFRLIYQGPFSAVGESFLSS